jgi:hypothetical protein
MANSCFFANLLGIYLTLFAISQFVYQKRFEQSLRESIASPAILQLMGSFYLLFGICLVLSHSVWVTSWPVAVTVVGYLILLKGCVVLLTPSVMIRIIEWLLKTQGTILISWFLLILGIYFLWIGWISL